MNAIASAQLTFQMLTLQIEMSYCILFVAWRIGAYT